MKQDHQLDPARDTQSTPDVVIHSPLARRIQKRYSLSTGIIPLAGVLRRARRAGWAVHDRLPLMSAVHRRWSRSEGFYTYGHTPIPLRHHLAPGIQSLLMLAPLYSFLASAGQPALKDQPIGKAPSTRITRRSPAARPPQPVPILHRRPIHTAVVNGLDDGLVPLQTKLSSEAQAPVFLARLYNVLARSQPPDHPGVGQPSSARSLGRLTSAERPAWFSSVLRSHAAVRQTRDSDRAASLDHPFSTTTHSPTLTLQQTTSPGAQTALPANAIMFASSTLSGRVLQRHFSFLSEAQRYQARQPRLQHISLKDTKLRGQSAAELPAKYSAGPHIVSAKGGHTSSTPSWLQRRAFTVSAGRAQPRRPSGKVVQRLAPPGNLAFSIMRRQLYPSSRGSDGIAYGASNVAGPLILPDSMLASQPVDPPRRVDVASAILQRYAVIPVGNQRFAPGSAFAAERPAFSYATSIRAKPRQVTSELRQSAPLQLSATSPSQVTRSHLIAANSSEPRYSETVPRVSPSDAKQLQTFVAFSSSSSEDSSHSERDQRIPNPVGESRIPDSLPMSRPNQPHAIGVAATIVQRYLSDPALHGLRASMPIISGLSPSRLTSSSIESPNRPRTHAGNFFFRRLMTPVARSRRSAHPLMRRARIDNRRIAPLRFRTLHMQRLSQLQPRYLPPARIQTAWPSRVQLMTPVAGPRLPAHPLVSRARIDDRRIAPLRFRTLHMQRLSQLQPKYLPPENAQGILRRAQMQTGWPSRVQPAVAAASFWGRSSPGREPLPVGKLAILANAISPPINRSYHASPRSWLREAQVASNFKLPTLQARQTALRAMVQTSIINPTLTSLQIMGGTSLDTQRAQFTDVPRAPVNAVFTLPRASLNPEIARLRRSYLRSTTGLMQSTSLAAMATSSRLLSSDPVSLVSRAFDFRRNARTGQSKPFAAIPKVHDAALTVHRIASDMSRPSGPTKQMTQLALTQSTIASRLPLARGIRSAAESMAAGTILGSTQTQGQTLRQPTKGTLPVTLGLADRIHRRHMATGVQFRLVNGSRVFMSNDQGVASVGQIVPSMEVLSAEEPVAFQLRKPMIHPSRTIRVSGDEQTLSRNLARSPELHYTTGSTSSRVDRESSAAPDLLPVATSPDAALSGSRNGDAEVDLDQLVEQVYELLTCRLAMERDRRG